MPKADDKLYLRFHGRVIDSLGIQMYQSPVAAVAELIANAWDADATSVSVALPTSIDPKASIVVKDDGLGMTFEDCQKKYLQVGRNRRVADKSDKSLLGRPLLGRKGIGKFAGFGIATELEIDTTSRETGERTKFTLNLDELRGEEYISDKAKEITVAVKDGPDESKTANSGTTITLRTLTLKRRPNKDSFAKSMARRFLINQTADEFLVSINESPIPNDNSLIGVEFDFPKDYCEDEKPQHLARDGDFGVETVGGGIVKWRVRFTKNPIETEELRGISVFCGIKVAQTPFFFNLSGGLPSQHGPEYLSGQVKADYLDQFDFDMITTERQRLNWELEETRPLEEWGQDRVKSLLSIWKTRRAQERTDQVESKLAQFSNRLEKLNTSERRTVKTAIRRLATIEALSDKQFNEMSQAILTAWEGGRLRGLIGDVAHTSTLDEVMLLRLLAEAQVLNALHVAEAVRAKVDIIDGLRQRIEKHELENAVRDYIANNPWLLAPEWETFRKEISVKNLLIAAAAESKLSDGDDGQGRVDLALSAGNQLLVVEFMRPGLTVDRDHINRYQEYIDLLRHRISANTELGFTSVSGLLVADKLDKRPGIIEALKRLADHDMKALEWKTLLEQASAKWQEFLDILISRVPNDERIKQLREEHGSS